MEHLLRSRRLNRDSRGGVVLDLVLAFGIILVGAFVLSHAGISFHDLLRGAEAFFGA